MKSISKVILASCVSIVLTGAVQAQTTRFNGQSGTIANPLPESTNVYRSKGCRDPWVAMALEAVYGRIDPALCAPSLYNNGSWSSYDQLVRAVYATKNQLAQQGVSLRLARMDNSVVLAVSQGGRIVAAGGGNLIGHDGSTLNVNSLPLIGHDGSTFQGAREVGPDQRSLMASHGAVTLPGGSRIVY